MCQSLLKVNFKDPRITLLVSLLLTFNRDHPNANAPTKTEPKGCY